MTPHFYCRKIGLLIYRNQVSVNQGCLFLYRELSDIKAEIRMRHQDVDSVCQEARSRLVWADSEQFL